MPTKSPIQRNPLLLAFHRPGLTGKNKYIIDTLISQRNSDNCPIFHWIYVYWWELLTSGLFDSCFAAHIIKRIEFILQHTSSHLIKNKLQLRLRTNCRKNQTGLTLYIVEYLILLIREGMLKIQVIRKTLLSDCKLIIPVGILWRFWDHISLFRRRLFFRPILPYALLISQPGKLILSLLSVYAFSLLFIHPNLPIISFFPVIFLTLFILVIMGFLLSNHQQQFFHKRQMPHSNLLKLSNSISGLQK